MQRFLTFLAGLAVFLAGFPNAIGELHAAGSSPASIRDFPYQLSVYERNTFRCSASIISARWAVTNAGCVYGKWSSNFTVHAGSGSILSGGVVHQVANVVTHPRYNASSRDFDVALLNFTRPLTFNGTIRAVSLVAQGQRLPEGSVGVVSGWGRATTGAFYNTLRQMSLPVLNQTSCASQFRGRITVNMFCAGYANGTRKDVCDFEGLSMVVAGRLIGIASWENGCNYGPRVFARVSSVRQWISSVARV